MVSEVIGYAGANCSGGDSTCGAFFFFTRPPRFRMARISHNRLAIFAFQSHHKMQNPSGTAYQQTHRAVQLRPSLAAECHHRWSQHSVLVCMAPGVGIRAL